MVFKGTSIFRKLIKTGCKTLFYKGFINFQKVHEK